MAMTKPSPSPYNPEDDLKTEGQFTVICTGVRQGIQSKQYADQTNVAIEFTVSEPAHKAVHGKKCAIVCIDSIYVDKKTKRASYFLQYARMMGYPNPEKGVDPDVFLDKWFIARCELFNGKCMVRQLMPIGKPSGDERQPCEMPDDNGVSPGVAANEQIPF